VKSFTAFSREFEIETELTVHAMQMRMPIAEVETSYKERQLGSASKLRTYRDGGRILVAIANLLRNERPLMFFSLIGVANVTVAVVLALPLLSEYLETGLVPRFPTAILCSALVVIAMLCVATGLTLDLVAHVRRESKRLVYLQHAAPHSGEWQAKREVRSG
jgi:hypothetical protein